MTDWICPVVAGIILVPPVLAIATPAATAAGGLAASYTAINCFWGAVIGYTCHISDPDDIKEGIETYVNITSHSNSSNAKIMKDNNRNNVNYNNRESINRQNYKPPMRNIPTHY